MNYTTPLVVDYYKSTKTYYKKDYCSYNGLLYRCKKQHSNHTPDDSEYWTLTNIMSEIKNSGGQFNIDSLDYVTPEMYGAAGDGVFDDAPALKEALKSDKPVHLTQDLWLFTRIQLSGHNVYLDGNGYTIHADIDNRMTKINDSTSQESELIHFISNLVAGSSPGVELANPPSVDDTPLRIIWDSVTDLNSYDFIKVPRDRSTTSAGAYRMGYISYRGHNPLPEDYKSLMVEDSDHLTIRYYKYMSVVIRNFTLKLRHCRGRTAIAFQQLCNSEASNISIISEDGEGAVGFSIAGCYNTLINNLSCTNFWPEYIWTEDIYANTASRGDGGYGLLINGDCVYVNNFTGINNKSNITVAGNNYFWTTNCVIDGAHVGFDIDQLNNHKYNLSGYSQGNRASSALNSHETAIYPIFNNIVIDMNNAFINTTVLSMRCPDVILNNIHVNAKVCQLSPYSINRTCWLNNIMAPGATLEIGWSNPEGYAGTYFYTRQLTVNNSRFFRISNCASQGLIKLTNCFIEQYVTGVQHLSMANTTIYGNYPKDEIYFGGGYDFTPLEVLGEAQITGCQIYHNRATIRNNLTPLIIAPPNSIRMSNTLLYTPKNNVIFSTEQSYCVNNTEIDLFGIILDDYSFGIVGTGTLN